MTDENKDIIRFDILHSNSLGNPGENGLSMKMDGTLIFVENKSKKKRKIQPAPKKGKLTNKQIKEAVKTVMKERKKALDNLSKK